MAQPIVRRDFRSSAYRPITIGICLILLSSPLWDQLPSVAAPRSSPAAQEDGAGAANPQNPNRATQNNPYNFQDSGSAGEITIAQPKIFQYERVNTLLDGLLRDVEGVSLADLTALDPNAANGAAVRFVQSMLEIGAQYNQGAAVSNALALQSYQAQQSAASQQVAANSAYLQQLYQQRQQVTSQLLTEQQLEVQLQAQAAAATGDTATTLTNQANAAASAVTSLQQELTTINTQITSASTLPSVALPTLNPTGGPTMPETANTFSDFLSKLPSGIQQDVNTQLQSPTLPATKRMDNFITLLYERMAREISALQDDVLRDPQNAAYLVQFDVGLYPSQDDNDRVARVDFTLNCKGCKVYSIYPGQSSYNLANYEGASKRNQFVFSLLTLIGFGLNADYRRQEDTLRGDLVQSVYMAGFQQAASDGDNFGWYYGAAPFEKLVTPGMRSTFAIISVPRSLITQPVSCPKASTATSLCKDDDENVQLPIDIDAGWAPRNDPSGYVSMAGIPRIVTITLPGTGGDLAASPVVLRERDHLHVLGIEYNPVYYQPTKPNSPNTATTTTTSAPGTAQAQASGTGTGTATVTVSGAGTASASSTGTGATSASATAANPPAAAAGLSTPAPADSFTGCPVGQCAAILVKLAEPIDPNLVVTVRGEPLRRVRDWRGRATSILPPVQSESDSPPPAPAAGTTTPSTSTTASRYEAVASRSLLEADQLGPDTWLEVDSHRLLLNISKNLAGGTDFPSIQIVAPGKRALFIPTDLDEGYTEIVTNGFHLLSRNGKQLVPFLCLHLHGGDLTAINTCTTTTKNTSSQLLTLAQKQLLAEAQNELYPAGPFPYETFLPLFLPLPGDQPIYAYLGETGVQLLISFADDPLNQTNPQPNDHSWLASHTQVMLEDEELDLAWSLECYPQGSQLVCDVPREEMRDAYTIVKGICSNADCLSTSSKLGDFPSISTLQVWVEQFDPDGDDYFRSAVPARLGRFPVQANENDRSRDENFKPWHFESAAADTVTATECNEPELGLNQEGKDKPKEANVSILGTHISSGLEKQPLTRSTVENPPDKSDCLSMKVPTVALTHPELAISYPDLPDSQPESLLTLQFRPTFGKPLVMPRRAQQAPFSIKSWQVRIPAARVDYNDSLDVPDVISKFKPQWMIAGVANPIVVRQPDAAPYPFGSNPAGWNDASRNEQIELVMNIDKTDLETLPQDQPIDVLRGTDRIGRLPNLWSLLLPTKLAAKYISPTQFSLQGKNAGAIDAVSVQGPGAPSTVLTSASGEDFALITLPAAAKPSANGSASTKATVSKPAPAKGQVGATIIIPGTNLGAQGKVSFVQGKNPAKAANVVCWNDVNLGVAVPAGVNAGAVTINVSAVDGTKIGSPTFTVVAGTPGSNQPTCKEPPVAALTAGTYTVLPLVSLGGGQYLPLDLTDKDGNALTFTVPAQPAKNDTATTDQSGKTTTITITKKTTGSQTPATATPAAKSAAAPAK